MTAIETILRECLAELSDEYQEKKAKEQTDLQEQFQNSDKKIRDLQLDILNAIKSSYEQHDITLDELNIILSKI